MPTIATPWCWSEKALTRTIPSTTATSDPGTTGARRRSPITAASETAPTSRVAPWMSPSSEITARACSKKLPEPLSTPSSPGTWPMMIVSASPTMKPLSTGPEMKLARKPRRSAPAISAARPVVIASAAVIAAKLPAPGATTSATVAADSAAVADIGPVTRCRELPRAA